MIATGRWWLCLTLAAGCSEPTRVPVKAAIRIIASPASRDTIDATPLQSLVVEIRDTTGTLASGLVVRFTSAGRMGGGMLVSGETASQFSDLYATTSTAPGRANALVRFGSKAGPSGIVVTVPELGVADTVPFTIDVGRLASLTIRPRDTVLAAGTTTALRATPADRDGNARSDAVRFTASGSPSSVGSVTESGQFSAVGPMGVAVIRAQAGAIVDSTTVAVRPVGQIAAYDRTQSALLLAQLDGTDRHFLTPPGTLPAGEIEPGWSPDGNEVAFPSQGNLAIVTVGGATRTLFPTLPSQLLGCLWPAYSADGRWIYFGGTAADGSGVHLWRTAPDGTGLQQLTTGGFDSRPSPSPDGQYVAFHRIGSGFFEVRILDLRTTTLTSFTAHGIYPEWNPTTNLIAYQDYEKDQLVTVRPDGTGEQRFSGIFTTHSMAWSPDGSVLLGLQSAGLALFQPSTGLVFALPASTNLTDMAWRPPRP